MTYFGERPDSAVVEAWNRTYLSHARDPEDRTRCADPDCPGRFPCASRLDAAELLILAGVGVPPECRLPKRTHDQPRPSTADSPATGAALRLALAAPAAG